MKTTYTPQQLDLLRRFGNRLRALRLERGFTQESLAEAAGLNRNYLSDVERGRRNIGLLNLILLAKAFNLPLSDLFFVDD